MTMMMVSTGFSFSRKVAGEYDMLGSDHVDTESAIFATLEVRGHAPREENLKSRGEMMQSRQLVNIRYRKLA